jgi:hypothetical protein
VDGTRTVRTEWKKSLMENAGRSERLCEDAVALARRVTADSHPRIRMHRDLDHDL